MFILFLNDDDDTCTSLYTAHRFEHCLTQFNFVVTTRFLVLANETLLSILSACDKTYSNNNNEYVYSPQRQKGTT